MVAATFPNLSFENPPGTGPTILNTLAEPYELAEDMTLEISLAGASTLVVFLAADFVDIAAATAAEVGAVLEAQVDDLGANDDGSFLRLTSLLTGEDVGLEVVGGSANVVLAFPAGAVSGETYAGGPPNGWAVSGETDSVTEWADFADENGRPEEIFDGDEWIAFVLLGTYSSAIFDLLLIPAPFESFSGWSTTGYLESFASAQASFADGLSEGFEIGWGTPLYFAFTPANLLAASVNPEDFETGWGQGGAATFSGPADFAGATKTAEDFEDMVPQWYVLVAVTAASGRWKIEIDGVTHYYDATGGDTESDIASGLATAVSTGSVRADAGSLGPIVSIWPVNPNLDIAVSAAPATGGELDLVLAKDYPLLAEEWVGQDVNPDFD